VTWDEIDKLIVVLGGVKLRKRWRRRAFGKLKGRMLKEADRKTKPFIRARAFLATQEDSTSE
jgi:hypothetical protein